MRKIALAVCLTVPLLTSCVSGSAAPATISDFCVVSTPNRPDEGFENRWTPAEIRWALKHNRYGFEHCGWLK